MSKPFKVIQQFVKLNFFSGTVIIFGFLSYKYIGVQEYDISFHVLLCM